ncbi:hypothetical protein ACFO25_04485 [Paenactinomyces guangxiensis]|uniref:DUF7408 domain-containing protein n=1 Tax=Paenactinomyces guangxiensis TaxID=1490290 RepID=A0A7W1WPJ1_9BACL|nr:hypothetical protein [Paenactinomyces guangxiensis]MBA4493635.1 hypothetical protein [Paenactinomyces guangxiensis]MBH8590922.1 hypothetical protein [Paenactinomyces guangxiensis]
MRWKQLCRWVCLVCLVAVPLSFFPVNLTESAPQKARLEVEPGWKGEYKGDFVPVKVRITGTSNVKGELSVTVPDSNSNNQKMTAFPSEKIEVASGATKEITLIVPKKMARPDASVVLLINGEVTAARKIGGRQLGTNDLAVGVLSDDHSVAPFAQGVAADDKNLSVHTYPLTVKDIPVQAQGLSGLDVLVINRLASESLTPAQLNAIHLWVTNGGRLLIGGGNQATVTAKGLEGLLPVQLTGKTGTAGDLKSLSTWGPPPSGTIEISQSVLKEGSRALATSGEQVLLASRNVGKGKVFYAGYDLAVAPMDGWAGNKKLWSQQLLFLKETDQRQMMQYNGIGAFRDPWGLQNALKKMPHITLPKMSILIVVFGLYVIIAGPVTYWVFARRKKHEWNWVAVPLVGILVAAGLYAYGNNLRGNAVLVHNIGIVNADSSGFASVHGASAIVSQDADDYKIKFPDGFAWPIEHEHISPQSAGSKKWISLQNGASILYDNVPQWSIRESYVELTKQVGGNLTGSFSYQNGRVVGKVNNGTRLKLKNVEVLLGNSHVTIGDLKPGESKDFTGQMSTSGGRLQVNPLRFRGREAEIYYLASQKLPPIRKYDVIGWTEDPLIKTEVTDHKIKSANLYLVNGTISKNTDAQGNLTLLFGEIEPEIINSTYPAYQDFLSDRKPVVMDNNGTITFEFPLQQKFDRINRLDIRTDKVKTEIYNWQNQRWELLAAMNKKAYSSYFSKDQRVRIRVHINAHQMIQQPQIEIEGRVKQ